MKKKVLITGAGLGGLCTALRLAKDGYDVTILEKNTNAGGRLNQLKKDGFTFDMAPTFFSMSYEFKELCSYCKIEMPFRFIELDPLYTVNFRGSSKNYTIYKNLSRLATEFASIEPDFEKKMRAYLKQAGDVFHDTEYSIVKKNFDTVFHYLSIFRKVPLKHVPLLFRSMWTEMSRYFDSYEVKVIFSLVAFFLGDTPFVTPAVYSLLNYTELVHDGYYNVEGGMYKITEGLLSELSKSGVTIHYNIEIVNYESKKNKLSSLIDHNGKSWQADIFVVNADAAWFRGNVFKRSSFNEAKLKKMKWTIAPFTLYLGLNKKIDQLQHHNYFLGNKFEEYAPLLLKSFNLIEPPYYYVNVPSKHNVNCAPIGHEAIFILCPVPDLRIKADWSDSTDFANTIIEDLSQRINVNLKDHIVSKTVLNPVDWEKMFFLYKGSGLGLAHNLMQVGYLRPKNKDEKFSNTYYVGASTIPGTGLPMVVVSSKLVAERINKEMNN